MDSSQIGYTQTNPADNPYKIFCYELIDQKKLHIINLTFDSGLNISKNQ